GLPLPDRAEGVAPLRGLAPASGPDQTVRFTEGDSLWSISAKHLGARATNAEISAYWRQLYAHNARTIGTDPDRILPGTQLDVPHG
ncbi:MAG: LysM peptidoglycan-binding domain-containing protein, partial [Nocardioidaceae bacterium]|nr:LysM peptidoglycan-binding domain-containing protein [Nocardioidaceae bacterium]